MKIYKSLSIILIIILSVVLIQAQSLSSNKSGPRPTIQEMSRQISRMRAEGKTALEIYRYQQTLFQPSAAGAISGTIFQSDGVSPLPNYVNINAYDLYGYFANSTYINAGDTVYSITSLPEGLYYIQADPEGNFVGEFYNDVIDWRQATLVRVGMDSQTTGIDFGLAYGKVISGKILEEISLDPVVGHGLQFLLYQGDATLETDTYRSIYTTPDPSGKYSIWGLAPGNYKLNLSVTGYQQEFYENKTNLALANTLSIGAETDTLKFINFLIAPIVAVQDGYEPNGTYQTAYEIVIGDSVTPQINPAGDVDYFSVNGLAGDTVQLIIKASSIGSAMYPYLGLYDSTGIYLLASTSGANIKVPQYYLPYSGRYYLRINHNGSGGGEEYYYILKLDHASTLLPGNISGNVYLDNLQTPYTGGGYNILLYDSETMTYFTSLSTQSPQFQISNIPSGSYKLKIDTGSDPIYLGEWFNDARTQDDADAILVTPSDTVKNVFIILDRGGCISGRIFLDNLSTDYTAGGMLYLEDGLNVPDGNAYSVAPNEDGLYLVSRLQPGEYKVGFSCQYPLYLEYPIVWYNQVAAPIQGNSLTVTLNDTIKNINFILLKGGRIQGFVHQPDGTTPLGFDSMQVDLMLYDPQSGNVISDMVRNTFSAGYRTEILFPGLYKFQAIAQISSLASWYYTNGHNFEDINTTDINIQPGTVHEVNITLDSGGGSISGVVYEEDGTTPTERAGQIFAYDASGHIVQSTVIGFDPATNQLLETGHYRLAGLKSGGYYLMLAFEFMEMRAMINEAGLTKSVALDGSNGELLPRVRKGIFNMKQVWYGQVVVDVANISYLQFQNIPEGAVIVNVTEPNNTPNINFSDMKSAIDLPGTATPPSEFVLESVYPNPFNPGTTIRYTVPYASHITIEIFDILGRKVAVVFDQEQSAGRHTVQWSGRSDHQYTVTSGIYIARLKAADKISSRKMILLK